MRPKLVWLVLFSGAIAVAVLLFARKSPSTPAHAFTSRTLAVAQFSKSEVNQFAFSAAQPANHMPNVSLSSPSTAGISELYVQNNVWQPGGSTGWHTHPGQSLIIVTEGTVTGYEADDPNCKPHAYTRGMGFSDPGGDHVHILRNEGNVVAKTVAIQLIPPAAMLRIEAEDPGNCHF